MSPTNEERKRQRMKDRFAKASEDSRPKRDPERKPLMTLGASRQTFLILILVAILVFIAFLAWPVVVVVPIR